MKIAVIDTGLNGAPHDAARDILPELTAGFTGNGDEVHLITEAAPVEDAAPVLAKRLNELSPDIYLIWASEDVGWLVLPLLNPSIATLAVGHADSEIYYAPARHYRSFLTRVIGTTPEVCVGFVLSCVIEKERVEWISDAAPEDADAGSAAENMQKIIETYLSCFEKAIADTHAAPREKMTDFPPMKASRPESQSWFSKLKAKILN
jgi:hypothetical protein